MANQPGCNFLWAECMFQNNNDTYLSQCSFTAFGGCPFAPLAHFVLLSHMLRLTT